MAGPETHTPHVPLELTEFKEQINVTLVGQLDKVHLENKVHESQNQFRTIFEESPYGSKIINADLQILRVNKALLSLLGYNEEELLQGSITDFSHPDYIDRWQALQRELWTEQHSSISMDTCLLKKDKSAIWCHVSSILFKDNGETFGYTIVEDISVRKELEKIRAGAEAKKDEFISLVSHELKTPITTIKAFNGLLERSVSPDARYYGFIKRSRHSIERLERLVEDLLDVTRINAGKMDLNYHSFDFNELLEESIEGLQVIHPSHRIILERSVPVSYTGDRLRLEQVIINLITNAVKYSPKASEVIVRLVVTDQNITVFVQDFGIGIAQKDIKNLFDRFYRVDNSTTTYQGLGLGLYIASAIIKRHGGERGIESQLGKGSTFWFSLPVN
jgi:PAS domain S-box-containing protein